MRSCFMAIAIIASVFLLTDCKKESDPVAPKTPALGSTSLSLLVLVEGSGTFVVSGGTEPYTISTTTNPSVISASITQRVVKVVGVNTGAATVTVTDGSSPARSVTVTVTVTTKITAGTAGSVSFSSNRGNYSASGIAEFGTYAPASGQGAIAMQDYESIFLLSYKVNSSTNMDMTLIGFVNNTYDYKGTFSYPDVGRIVYISYYPGTNPTDSTFLSSGYLLASSATAQVTSFSASALAGTFFGNGYFIQDTSIVSDKTITVTNGVFSAPIVHIGLMPERSMEKKARSVFRTVMGKNVPFGFRAAP